MFACPYYNICCCVFKKLCVRNNLHEPTDLNKYVLEKLLYNKFKKRYQYQTKYSMISK